MSPIKIILLFLILVPTAGATDLVGDGNGQLRGDRVGQRTPLDAREEREEEIDEAAAEEERRRREYLSRVLVIRWEDTSTDFTNENVQRNVRSRIARPDAMFFPEYDLYQRGRKVPDTTVIPANQPALVPESAIEAVMSVVEEVSAIGDNALNVSEWAETANRLLALADSIWFVDRVELREPLFMLYAQIGRAADNQYSPAPPYYEQVGDVAVNYYYYLAAQLAYQEPALLSRLSEPLQVASIGYLHEQIQSGFFSPLTLDFTLNSSFDIDDFNESYSVLLNGLPVDLDPRGQIDVFPGITDIYLVREDTGHGLSERLESIKLDEAIYSVIDVAQKKMGLNFKDQLFLHQNECSPEVDGDILNYLSIYQKLHLEAEVYVAVPENGNPNKVWIWRYDPDSALLYQVGGGPDNFPVRFATIVSTGVLYNGASISIDNPGSSLLPSDLLASSTPESTFDSNAIPFDFEMRLHYNRLMFNFGIEGGYAASSDGWVEYFQTPGVNSSKTWENNDQVATYDLTDCEDVDTDGDEIADTIQCPDALNVRSFNRHLYVGLGAVLGRDAAIGFGPRIAAQFGWVNMPHSFQPTLHFGWALPAPLGDFTGRFRPMIDIDGRAGMAVARARSLQLDRVDADPDNEKLIMPVFGLNIGIGFTY